jgi:hypothetical protein
MKKELMTLFLFIGICFVAYLLFKNLDFSRFREGMTDGSGNPVSDTIPQDGVAGNAASFGAALKAANIRFQDQFLISKYRSDYEAIILDWDDLLSNIMLKTVLTGGKTEDTLKKLANMNSAKAALNNIMLFVDKK